MATTTTTSNPTPTMTYYDIAMRPPVTGNAAAVNPWKARLALNFKNAPYSTTWVKLPEVSKVRRSLNLPACRKFADGSDFYTLPILSDPTTNSLIGDSFDIAVYLQKTYPASGDGDLFPPQTLDYELKEDLKVLVPLSERNDTEYADYARFNNNVDAAFSVHTLLMVQKMPFDPETAEESKAEFVRRAGFKSWDDFALDGEKREQVLSSFRDMLGDLARMFDRDTSGPFLLGQRPSHADFIVGGWLRMSRVTLPSTEWEQLRGWHGGVFGRLHDALDVYAEVK
ncbi:glutathione S-transferas-like protein [Aspergillus costaricaensis CBS 115574]|uniref:Glutathione S-transferas-like protein n=1 Tax=Aspergillus costaricaensis CBS 115574 TaxID=1448317 RepID=A0ACD1I1Y0_9EURO|nr:glutathione S-transferas-like protein [Aspergillus costaricaensis CBS 115574]RAK84049.1 glutathione S-transferas-like protein [Aspergillus costaricaensis CBS 115574]